MPSHEENTALIRFLVTSSQASMGDLLLARLNRDTHLRKQVMGMIDQLVENLAVVYMAQFLRDHREELISLLRSIQLEAIPDERVPERDTCAKSGKHDPIPGRK